MAATADLLSAPRIVPPAFRTIPSFDHGLQGAGRLHGVHVRAEEERRPLGGRRKAAVEVSRVRADPCAGIVLVDLETEPTQLGGDSVGDRTLLARRRRQRRKLEEEVEDAH